MAKIPTILEAGRADGKLINSNNVYYDSQEKFLSDKLKEIDDNHNTLNNTINYLTNTVNNNEFDIENKLEAEKNRATNAENNLRETINNITANPGQVSNAENVIVNTLPNSTASNVQQALYDSYENMIKLSFASRANECLYNKWCGTTGNISSNDDTFVTPLLPFNSTSAIVQNNSSSYVYFVLFTEDFSETDYYTIGSNQLRGIQNIDSKFKWCRCTFGMNNKECFIKSNDVYLWYGYYDYYYSLLSRGSSDLVNSRFVLTGGSILQINRANRTITFPATCGVLYNGKFYQNSAAFTLSTPHNNGYVVFNPNNISVNNGIKDANYDYIPAEGEVILFSYNMVYYFLSLPKSRYYSFNDIKLVDYDTKIEFIYKLQAAKTASRVKGSTVPLQLVWFSDVHAFTHSIVWMKAFLSEIGAYQYIDDIISSGDQVTQYFNPSFEWWHDDANADDILQVIGNHECREQTTNADTHTASEVYQKFFYGNEGNHNYIANWGVQSAGENLCYYYKDYPVSEDTKKFRLIVLDCMHYDEAQNTWLKNTLASANTNNLSVIVVSHFRADIPDYIENPFTSLYRDDVETLNSGVCATIQSFIDGGGKFICHLAGHTHYDAVYTCHNYPQQLGIIISTASPNQEDNSHQVRNSPYNRFTTLFNCISFDIDGKLVRILRPVCNMDRWNRAQNTLVINYETKQIVYND